MIRMTLHAVTVECETLTQALCLLDQWAQMGRITLPPESKTSTPSAARLYSDVQDAMRAVAGIPSPSPSVPPPAQPTPRRARGTLPSKECEVCGAEFTAPSPRTITCERHRMKPGQKLADIRKAYERERAKAGTKTAPKHSPDVSAAKALLGRPPIKPSEPTKPCSACGDKTRAADLDSAGRCRDCQPIGGAK